MNTANYVTAMPKVTSYSICPPSILFKESVHILCPHLLHDRPKIDDWEKFDEAQLPLYFKDNIKKFLYALEDFADLSHPYTSETGKRLIFMCESLVQIRESM